MADDRYIADLDTAMWEAEAAVARDERIAAEDLALSLRQDRSLRETLLAWRSFDVRLPAKGWVTGSEIGRDHVLVGSATYVPLHAVAMVMPSDAPGARMTDLSLLQILRRSARRSGQLSAGVGGSVVVGRLLQASSDHLVIRVGASLRAVGMKDLEYVDLLDHCSPRPGEPS